MHRPQVKKGCSTVSLILVAAFMMVVATLIGFAAVFRGGLMVSRSHEADKVDKAHESHKPEHDPIPVDTKASETKVSQASTQDPVPEVVTKAGAMVQQAAYDIATLQAAAKVLNSELMEGIAIDQNSYNKTFKNPCWTGGDGKTQCLPYLILTGGFHSGSRGLVHALEQHPDIVTGPASNSQFWAEDGKSLSDYLKGWQPAVTKLEQSPSTRIAMDVSSSTFAFYMAAGGKAHSHASEARWYGAPWPPHRHYGTTFKSCYENCTSTFSGQKEAREQCVDSQCYRQAWQAELKTADETHLDYYLDHHVPMLIKAVYGSRTPKLVALVRDPVERLHSAFYSLDHYHGKYGNHPDGFLAYVRDQVAAFNNCTSLHDANKCVLYFEAMGAAQEKVYYHCDQLLRGVYAAYMEVWMRYFPSEFMIIQSEHYFEDPAALLQHVTRHAGLSEPAREQAKQWFETYTIPRHVKGRPMLKEARQLLYNFYRPWNLRLAEMTGMKHFLQWNTAQEKALAAPLDKAATPQTETALTTTASAEAAAATAA